MTSAKDKDKKRVYRHTYYLKNKGKLRGYAKKYYLKNKGHYKEYYRKRYQKYKAEHIDRMKVYRLTHLEQINEWSRNYFREKHGLPPRVKPYSFYRDFIRKLNIVLAPIQRDIVFAHLLKLRLTKKQREMIEMTRDGMSTKEQCAKLGCNQSSYSKGWGGQTFKIGAPRYGGIHKKFHAYIVDHIDVQKLLAEYKLKWQ
jgi:DNA-binding CsgD family transcriptional regulator